MEAAVKPIDRAEMQVPLRMLFDGMRDHKKGDRMNVDENSFVKRLLPFLAGRRLTAEEKATLIHPYPTPESRKPSLCGQEKSHCETGIRRSSQDRDHGWCR
jgi:hypothetical protein